jgi:nitrilase
MNQTDEKTSAALTGERRSSADATEAEQTAAITFRAAAVQESSVWLDREGSTEKACALIREAGRGGADIVALPESFVPGFPYWVFCKPLSETGPFHLRLHENAVEVPGPTTDALAAAAGDAGVVAVVGVTERDPGRIGTLYNTNVVLGPEGSLLGKHRKLMPTWGERAVWHGGDGSTLDVFPTRFGALGTLNCGENVNTLARFALLDQGERIHVANFPSAALIGGQHTNTNDLYLPCAAHAYEGKLHVIAVQEYGTQEVAAELGVELGTEWNALSGVVGADGDWVTPPLRDEPGIAYADCSLEATVTGRLFHDIVGHYNRFDVLRLELDRTVRVPVREIPAG